LEIIRKKREEHDKIILKREEKEVKLYEWERRKRQEEE